MEQDKKERQGWADLRHPWFSTPFVSPWSGRNNGFDRQGPGAVVTDPFFHRSGCVGLCHLATPDHPSAEKNH